MLCDSSAQRQEINLCISAYTSFIISLFWSIENLQAAEAALESSEDEEYGARSPPPTKKARLEGLSPKSSSRASSSSHSKSSSRRMHRKMAGNGDSSESSENGELVCDVSNGECSASLGEDKIAALKEKNREKLALKKLSVFDEELLRLVGQHLGKLGFRYCNFVVNFLSCFVF